MCMLCVQGCLEDVHSWQHVARREPVLLCSAGLPLFGLGQPSVPQPHPSSARCNAPQAGCQEAAMACRSSVMMQLSSFQHLLDQSLCMVWQCIYL